MLKVKVSHNTPNGKYQAKKKTPAHQNMDLTMPVYFEQNSLHLTFNPIFDQ